MDHLHFKSNQTAAAYVAHGLAPGDEEEFELHMMSCTDCVDDVETWRALKDHLPRAERAEAKPVAPSHDWRWQFRIAASVAAVGILGAGAGGWYAGSMQDAALEGSQMVFFNAPSLSRGGGDCSVVHMAANTRVVAVRVAAVAGGERVTAIDSDGRELPNGSYRAALQPDGSWLLRFNAAALKNRLVRLEARGAAGSSEPLLCVTGDSPPSG